MSVKSGITHLFELQPGEVVLSLVGPILPECWFQISDRIVHGLNDNNGNTHYFVQLTQWGGGREAGDNVCSRIYIGIFLLTDWHQWSDSVIIKTIILSPIDHSQSFHHQTGINSNCYFYHHTTTVMYHLECQTGSLPVQGEGGGIAYWPFPELSSAWMGPVCLVVIIF